MATARLADSSPWFFRRSLGELGLSTARTKVLFAAFGHSLELLVALSCSTVWRTSFFALGPSWYGLPVFRAAGLGLCFLIRAMINLCFSVEGGVLNVFVLVS